MIPAVFGLMFGVVCFSLGAAIQSDMKNGEQKAAIVAPLAITVVIVAIAFMIASTPGVAK